MAATHTRAPAGSRRTRNKVLALAASGTVLIGSLGVASLAAWSDFEWVVGGVGADDAGITASTFEVEQFASGDAAWDHWEDEDTDINVVDFSALAAALTPGDTVYGYVRLRTVTGSLDGEVSLSAHTAVVADEFSDALEYGAWLLDDFADCDEDVATAGGTVLVAAASALDVDGAAPFALGGATTTDPGTEQTVCFEIHFPDTYEDDATLQGDTVTPVWSFDAISV